MTLQNLLGISLDAIAPDRATVAKLLAAADRNLWNAIREFCPVPEELPHGAPMIRSELQAV